MFRNSHQFPLHALLSVFLTENLVSSLPFASPCNFLILKFPSFNLLCLSHQWYFYVVIWIESCRPDSYCLWLYYTTIYNISCTSWFSLCISLAQVRMIIFLFMQITRMFPINVGSPICSFRMKAFVILALHYKKGLQIGLVTLFHSSVLLCISPSINTC